MKTLIEIFLEHPEGRFTKQPDWLVHQYIYYDFKKKKFVDQGGSFGSYNPDFEADKKMWQLYEEPKEIVKRGLDEFVMSGLSQGKTLFQENQKLKKENEELKRSHLFVIERNQELLDKIHELSEKPQFKWHEWPQEKPSHTPRYYLVKASGTKALAMFSGNGRWYLDPGMLITDEVSHWAEIPEVQE